MAEYQIKMGEISHQESIYKDIFESFLDLYVRCDLSGKITMLSPSVKDITGHNIEEVIGKNVTNYYLYNSRTKSLYKTLLIQKNIKNFEIEITSKSGDIIPCICNIRFLFNKKGKPTGLECICRNVTKLVQTKNDLIEAVELAEQALKVKDQFLANMSHEIRTPMNGIMGLMDLMEQSGLNRQQLTYLQTMRHSSEILLKLMNNIIYLTKVRAKKVKPAKNIISFSKLLNEIKLLFQMEAQKKNLSVSIVIDKKVPSYIETDETRLSQILSNLLSNAIKFSRPDEKIFIEVNVEKILRQNIILKIDVIDNGVGIAKKYHTKLFKSFTQVDDSYSKNYSGAGLGLSISKELVELLNGEICVESDYGKGSKFTFTFKAKPSSEPKKKIPIQKNKDLIQGVSSSVLLVDDNNVNRMVAKKILNKANHRVDTAIDGFKAIKLVESNTYDIILMDIQLPGINGVDTMVKIKNLLTTNCPPIIAVTAFSSDQDKKNFLHRGFDGYLGKPFSATDIISLIEHWQQDIPTKYSEKIKPRNKKHQTLNIDTINQLISYSDFKTIEASLIEFNHDTMADLKSCKKLLKNEEYEKLGGLIHNIKGNSGTLGGDDLFELSRKIEQNIKKGDFSTLHDDLKSLSLKLSVFNTEVEKKLNIALDE